MMRSLSIPLSDSSTDFFRWISDYLEDVIHSDDPKKRINFNVYPIELNRSSYKEKFKKVEFLSSPKLERYLSRIIGMDISIKNTKDNSLFYIIFSKSSRYNNKPIAVFEKEINGTNLLYLFSLGNKPLLKKLVKRMTRTPLFDVFWIEPTLIREKIIESGSLSGFTAKFNPIDEKAGLHGKGRRTIRLWGKNAAEELELVEERLFTKAYSMNFERGTPNPGPVSISVDINGQISTRGGHKGAFRIFMDSLNSFEEVATELRIKDPESYLSIGYIINPITQEKNKLSILNPVRLRLDHLEDEDFKGIKSIFLCSKKYAGNLIWSDPPSFTIHTIDKSDGSSLYIHILAHKNEIILSPSYKSNIGTRDRAHQSLLYSINPRFELQRETVI